MLFFNRFTSKLRSLFASKKKQKKPLIEDVTYRRRTPSTTPMPADYSAARSTPPSSDDPYLAVGIMLATDTAFDADSGVASEYRGDGGGFSGAGASGSWDSGSDDSSSSSSDSYDSGSSSDSGGGGSDGGGSGGGGD